MSDIKRAFEKAGVKGTGGEGMKKKCEKCGNEFVPKEPHHKICHECNRKVREGLAGADSPKAKLPDDYLTRGYFDENGYLREGIFKGD